MYVSKSHTLDVPGAVLHYDVRGDLHTTEPILLLIASPMDASGFTSLATHFPDRTVVTYDPRGVTRSKRTDDATQSTPEQHGDDLHRLISTLDAEAVDLFASSGGAVNALALVAKHPEQVRTLVAHEPPTVQVLPDRDQAIAASRDVYDTYHRSGMGPAMAKFIALTSHQGPLPADYLDQPAPAPGDFGLPTEDDGSRDDPLLGESIVPTARFQPDFEALRAASTHVILAAGVESRGQLTYRAAAAIAERLGTGLVEFPSHHGGFLGGEFGWRGEPEAFAVKLREVLTATT
jgi:pimeloyl-ACP methyl ester carboxylesterase